MTSFLFSPLSFGKKMNFDFFLTKSKYLDIWCSYFAAHLILHFARFSFAIYLKTVHSGSLRKDAFLPMKMAQHGVIKASFPKKNTFPWIFLKLRWKEPNWCWIMCWKIRVDICRRVLANEKIRERAESVPLPNLAGSGLDHSCRAVLY